MLHRYAFGEAHGRGGNAAKKPIWAAYRFRVFLNSSLALTMELYPYRRIDSAVWARGAGFSRKKGLRSGSFF
jgi:hypothetical protein